MAISSFIMEIPSRAARPGLALPSIYVQDSNPSDPYRSSSRSSSYNSTSSPATIPGPMSIPNARDPVPPPLPPPRHLADIAESGGNGDDIAWQWGNSHESSDWGRSIPPGSSLYGSFASGKSMLDHQPDSSRRTSSTSTIKSISGAQSRGIDEGYASLTATSMSSNKSVPSHYCIAPFARQ